jgi:hypothetical protein
VDSRESTRSVTERIRLDSSKDDSAQAEEQRSAKERRKRRRAIVATNKLAMGELRLETEIKLRLDWLGLYLISGRWRLIQGLYYLNLFIWVTQLVTL